MPILDGPVQTSEILKVAPNSQGSVSRGSLHWTTSHWCHLKHRPSHELLPHSHPIRLPKLKPDCSSYRIYHCRVGSKPLEEPTPTIKCRPTTPKLLSLISPPIHAGDAHSRAPLTPTPPPRRTPNVVTKGRHKITWYKQLRRSTAPK